MLAVARWTRSHAVSSQGLCFARRDPRLISRPFLAANDLFAVIRLVVNTILLSSQNVESLRGCPGWGWLTGHGVWVLLSILGLELV